MEILICSILVPLLYILGIFLFRRMKKKMTKFLFLLSTLGVFIYVLAILFPGVPFPLGILVSFAIEVSSLLIFAFYIKLEKMKIMNLRERGRR